MIVVIGAVLGLMIGGSVLGNVKAQETEEERKVIEMASMFFVICIESRDKPDSDINSLLLEKCDYDIKFLKGLCESTNNQYEYCTANTTMDTYLIVRGQHNEPRPNDVWCDHFIDKCIESIELAKEDSIELFGDDEDKNTMIDFYDDQIEKLEERK